jgi:phosphonate transport system substrate-binding protein
MGISQSTRAGRWLGAIVLGALLQLTAAADASADTQGSCRAMGKPLVFGILPFISVEHLVARFSPLSNYLARHLQVPVLIETAPDFIEFAERTHLERRYDILFTAPHFHSQAVSKAGYRMVASVDSPGMWAVIVVPVASDIQSVKDLKGRRLATVHPMSLATLLVRNHLFEAGIDPDVDLIQVITPSHDASLLSAYHGVTDASALMKPPFDSASETVRNSMRVIARTRSTPHIPISVGPWVSDDCAAEISDILLNMNTNDEGRAALDLIQFSGFKQGDPEVYEELNRTLFR